MRTNNYDKMVADARKIFLTYDQQKMTEKFHLKTDDGYLYLCFIGREYRVGRLDGVIDGQAANGWERAGFDEAMSIYDMLCYSVKRPELSGQYVTLESLNRVHGRGIQSGSMYREYAEYFDGKTEALKKACEVLGGVPGEKGDVCFVIPVFDFFPLCLRFWESDEDFPASLQFFMDRNALDFLHFETLWYIVSYLCDRLKTYMEQ